MTHFATSADGTRIAFDRLGSGPPLIVVGGILCDRGRTRALAERLAARCTVVNYDRRGRGESGDTAPYAVAREVEDLAALIAALGGRAALYGHSSGAGLALHAAAAGLPVTHVVLHEPPYGGSDDESMRHARAFAGTTLASLAADRRAEAVRSFFVAAGAPPEMADAASGDPTTLALAHTMRYDIAVMGDADGGAIPEALVRRVRAPTLVLAGSASPDFFHETAARIAELVPHGTLAVLDGADHGAPADVVAPAVAAFVTGAERDRGSANGGSTTGDRRPAAAPQGPPTAA